MQSGKREIIDGNEAPKGSGTSQRRRHGARDSVGQIRRCSTADSLLTFPSLSPPLCGFVDQGWIAGRARACGWISYVLAPTLLSGEQLQCWAWRGRAPVDIMQPVMGTCGCVTRLAQRLVWDTSPDVPCLRVWLTTPAPLYPSRLCKQSERAGMQQPSFLDAWRILSCLCRAAFASGCGCVAWP